MRLAVVVDLFPCWSERFIARELTELLRRGIDLTLFALRHGPPQGAWDPDFSPLRERLAPEPLGAPASTAAGLLAGGNPLAADPWLGRPSCLAVRKALGRRGLVLAARAWRLNRLLREGGFTWLHAHFANRPSTLAWLALQGLDGLGFSLSAHAYDLFVEPQFVPEKAARAALLLACHRDGLLRLQALCGPAQEAKVRLMPHGLPLDAFAFREDGPRPAAGGAPGPRLLGAGRFVEKKGFRDLLEAFLLLRGRAADATLTLCGEGPLEPELRRFMRERGLEGAVRLLPPQSGPGLRELLRQAHLLVVPARPAADGDRDGIPNLVLEAFALGTPVVGSDGGGLSEVVREETGWVVPAGQPQGLAEMILRALADPQGLEARRGRARRLVESRFDIRKNITPLLEAWGL